MEGLADEAIGLLTDDAKMESMEVLLRESFSEYSAGMIGDHVISDIENGVNDVDDFITGYIRTDKASISFNGAWAQNLDKGEMFIDFLGDKKGARLTYGGQFEVTDGETLETTKTEHEIPNMYLREDEDFFNSIESGVKNKNNIDNILESMKLLDYLYKSAEIGKEIQF